MYKKHPRPKYHGRYRVDYPSKTTAVVFSLIYLTLIALILVAA